MTPLERDMSELTRDVAVVVSIQKQCQKSQAQTTANVDKLVTAVNVLSHDTVYLQGLETRMTNLEETSKWVQRSFISTLVAAVGTIIYHIFKASTV